MQLFEGPMRALSSDAQLLSPQLLPPGEVHVWIVNLERSFVSDADAAHHLSSDEQARASRFHHPRDRRRYTQARSLLRVVLAAYLNCEPGAIEFGYAEHGKPFLKNPNGGVFFNLSHSQERGLLAFNRRGEVGVDLEYIEPRVSALDIVSRCFSPETARRFSALPALQQQDVFFRLWTAREAFVKAAGTGLFATDDSIELAEGNGCEMMFTRKAAQSQWTLHELTVAPGFAAALVVPAGLTLRIEPHFS